MKTISVYAELAGNVWKVEAREGDKVSEGDVLIILESMKMEIPIVAPEDGVIKEIKINEGDVIQEGELAIVLEI